MIKCIFFHCLCSSWCLPFLLLSRRNVVTHEPHAHVKLAFSTQHVPTLL
jgi:hypothetical protein